MKKFRDAWGDAIEVTLLGQKRYVKVTCTVAADQPSQKKTIMLLKPSVAKKLAKTIKQYAKEAEA